MSLFKTFSVLLFGVLFASNSLAAPSYISSDPLTKVVSNTEIKDVNSGEIQVPIITWGGDIATILANGNDLKTQSGSLFSKQNLKLKLVRKDAFADQLKDYLSGKSPFLRGTMGMINMASEAISKDPRTKPVVIYQMTWSTGGDALVVKSNIHSIKDLKGKTIALQAYGPHVDYMTKMLADAGLSAKDVTIKWLPDLTGTDDAPMAALQTNDVDAAFVITPDAMVLTSGGTVGTGAEDSVKGAKILLSTRTANRIISDVYAVRSDYFEKNKSEIEGFVGSLLKAEEELQTLFKAKSGSDYQDTLKSSAKILLDSEQATADVLGLYADCSFVGWDGNVEYFSNPNYPRSFSVLTNEIQKTFLQLGLISKENTLAQASWDYEKLRAGLNNTGQTAAPTFKQEEVATIIAKRQQQGSLDSGELFKFEIFFEPNQNSFSSDLYEEAFNQVVKYASTYGGALITVEGHSDPLGYLRKKKDGESNMVLGRIKQSAKNLSLSRAVTVRDSVIDFSNTKNINLDPSQFAVVGQGISNPKSGVCGESPCPPKTEKAWRDNMRVEFRVIQVEAEESAFNPL